MKTAPPSSLPDTGAGTEALIKEARRRQRRRYLLTGVTALVVLARGHAWCCRSRGCALW